METSSNTVLYATRKTRREKVTIASATAANTYTLLATADATKGSMFTDLLCRSADATARVFDIIICATGSQATAHNWEVAVSIPANSGNNGTVALASVAALAPSIFDIDLAGNRVIMLEVGQSIYVKNLTLTAGAIYWNAKLRDYNA